MRLVSRRYVAFTAVFWILARLSGSDTRCSACERGACRNYVFDFQGHPIDLRGGQPDSCCLYCSGSRFGFVSDLPGAEFFNAEAAPYADAGDDDHLDLFSFAWG